MSEETKDCARLPVVATPAAKWLAGGQPDPHGDRYNCERAELAMGGLTDDELANGAFMNYDQPLNIAGIVAGTHSSPIAWMTAVKDRIRWLSRRLTDAQARLAEKDARIAQLAAHARGKNKALANALKEIERLRLNIAEYNEHESCWRAEIANLRAQLEQLQAAPAERGVVRQETNFVASTGEGRNPLYEGQFDDETPEQAERRLHWSRTAMEVQSARLNPAPATADSDVREVSE